MIFIYPNGYYTHCLLDMLKDYKLEITKIDDSLQHTSLKAIKPKIKNTDTFLICNGEIYDILEQNVKNEGIENYQNAFLYFTNFIAQKLKTCKIKINLKNNLAQVQKNHIIELFDTFYVKFSMFLTEDMIATLKVAFLEAFKDFRTPLPKRNLAINLSFGNSDKFLNNLDQKIDTEDILYIFNTKKHYYINKDRIKSALIAPSVLIELLSNSKVILTNTYPSFRINTSTVIFLPHCIYPFLSATKFFRTNESVKKYIENVYVRDLDYILISSAKELSLLKEILLSKQLQKFIPIGYPSLDYNIAHKCENEDCNLLLFAYSFVQDLLDYEEFNSLLLELKDYKIAIRYHNQYINSKVLNKLLTLQKKYNFIIDDSSNQKIYSRTGLLISDLSSVSHTFSLTYLKRSIIFTPNKYFHSTTYKTNFINSEYQTWAFSKEELLEQIQIGMNQDSSLEILKHRKENIYNLNNSADFIANFINKRLSS